MAPIPPPRRLTREEFYKAIKDGKRTFSEIDPEFQKWLDECDQYRRWGFVCLISGVVMLLIMMVIIMLI